MRVALDLLNDGNTIPFVARYRKEATGALDEVALQTIQEQAKKEQELFDRKNAVIKLIEAAGKLTAPLKEKIQGADDLATVEDLYLPYKQKRRTKKQKRRTTLIKRCQTLRRPWPARTKFSPRGLPKWRRCAAGCVITPLSTAG